MKFISRETSRSGDTTVFTVQLNTEEAKILRDLVLNAAMNTPKIFQFRIVRQRLKSMFKTFTEML